MSERGSKVSKSEKSNAGFLTRCEKSASVNKKSIESEGNGSEKSVNWRRNTSVSVVSVPAKSVSKNASGVHSGMSRSSASENNVRHAHKSG